MKWDNLPRAWPDHFDEAICTLNWRILPALKFHPKEILLGLVVTTKPTPIEESASLITPVKIDAHMAYEAQQQASNYGLVVSNLSCCCFSLGFQLLGNGVNGVFELVIWNPSSTFFK